MEIKSKMCHHSDGLRLGARLGGPLVGARHLFNPFPDPGISHGRPLARRDRPDGAVMAEVWNYNLIAYIPLFLGGDTDDSLVITW